jgi:hypothetical protein
MSGLDAILPQIEEALGTPVVEVAPISGGGYTPALRRRLDLADGRRVFVKAPGNDLTAGWLRQEQAFYTAVKGDFLPEVLAMGAGEVPWLALEFLPSGWPPPWTPESITAVRAALATLHTVTPPDHLLPLPGDASLLTGWRRVAADPRPFLTTGACDEAWLTRHLPALLAATDPAAATGRSVLHLDVRSDNVYVTGRGALLVDWNFAAVGNPQLDVAFWQPSLTLETGTAPDDDTLDPRIVTMVAGFFASLAGEPAIPDAPGVRPFQRAQLGVALPWAARALGLPPPASR